ncbi:MAG: hypothetical protein ACRCYS_11425 [Beijerinckiaceae bacterium]
MGNGAQPGATNARFDPYDAVFAALDSLDEEVRQAIYDAPVPFSPIDVANYGRSSGLRGSALANVVRAQSAKIIEQAARRG